MSAGPSTWALHCETSELSAQLALIPLKYNAKGCSYPSSLLFVLSHLEVLLRPLGTSALRTPFRLTFRLSLFRDRSQPLGFKNKRGPDTLTRALMARPTPTPSQSTGGSQLKPNAILGISIAAFVGFAALIALIRFIYVHRKVSKPDKALEALERQQLEQEIQVQRNSMLLPVHFRYEPPPVYRPPPPSYSPEPDRGSYGYTGVATGSPQHTPNSSLDMSMNDRRSTVLATSPLAHPHQPFPKP